MSRRKVTIKYFPVPDGTYNSYLVNILISRIVKSGKKTLAQNIVNDTHNSLAFLQNKGTKINNNQSEQSNKVYSSLTGT